MQQREGLQTEAAKEPKPTSSRFVVTQALLLLRHTFLSYQKIW